MTVSHTLRTLPEPLPVTARFLLGQLQKIDSGCLRLITPAGHVLLFGQAGCQPHAELRVENWSACRKLLTSGEIGFAEAYRDGLFDSPDLTALLCLALKNETVLGSALSGSVISRWWYRLRHLLHRNSRKGSQRNIHAHYDLGNSFYRLWLDRSLTYSSAWFNGRYDQPLERAQAAKYQRICDVLQLKPGMRVLEIGCGWGGFAEHAARQGVAVHGVTISRAQLQLARQRLMQQPLVELELCDYRDLDGRYDAIVSIEMFEAVGEAFWDDYFRSIKRLLKAGGKALIQSITIDEQHFDRYRHSSDFIQAFIFPGGMLPACSVFQQYAGRAGLSVQNQLDFGRDYAETLRRWRQAFESSLEDVRRQGFDEAFIRLWRMYLCYCEVGFDQARIGVAQFLLQEHTA